MISLDDYKLVFLFTCNRIGNANPKPGYDLDEFQNGQYVAMGFTIYASNVRSKKNLGSSFKYNF